MTLVAKKINLFLLYYNHYNDRAQIQTQKIGNVTDFDTKEIVRTLFLLFIGDTIA